MFYYAKIFLILLFSSTIIYAKGVSAGTQIFNIAHLKYTMDNENFTISSNRVVDMVDMVSNLRLSCMESVPILVSNGSYKNILRFKISNSGNAQDNFELKSIRNSTININSSKIFLTIFFFNLNESLEFTKEFLFVELKPSKSKVLNINLSV